MLDASRSGIATPSAVRYGFIAFDELL
jgi:hypothetical protein